MKAYTHIIWDFNGTVYDDVDACVRTADRLLSAHGLPPIKSVANYREAFGFPVSEYYRRIGFNFQKVPYADLAVEWVAYYLEESKNSTVYPQVREVTAYFRKKGIRQLILSATETGMLRSQTERLGISDLFDELWGIGNIHAQGKTEIGMVWRKKNPDAQALLIGDTDHDAEVARTIGADCILLTSGHQSRRRLEQCISVAVIDNLSQLLDI